MPQFKLPVEYFHHLDFDNVHSAFFKFGLSVVPFDTASKLKYRKCSWCVNYAHCSADFISLLGRGEDSELQLFWLLMMMMAMMMIDIATCLHRHA